MKKVGGRKEEDESDVWGPHVIETKKIHVKNNKISHGWWIDRLKTKRTIMV